MYHLEFTNVMLVTCQSLVIFYVHHKYLVVYLQVVGVNLF